MITQRKFLIAEQEFERELFGSFDENIKLIEDTLSIDVILREGNIVLMGEEKNVDLAYKLMTELQETVINGKSLDRQSVTYSLSLLLEGSEMMIKELDDVIVVTKKGNSWTKEIYRINKPKRYNFWYRTSRYRENLFSSCNGC